MVFVFGCAMLPKVSSFSKARPQSSGGSGKKASGPPRITSETVGSSGMSLKTQLQLVRATKKKASPPPTLKSKSNKRAPDKVAEVKKNSETRFDGSDGIMDEPALLLVDGYNMIFATESLAQMVESESLDAARRQLCDMVAKLGAIRGWRACVVFDAGPGSDDEPNEEDRIDVVFTKIDQTADAVIECKAYDRRGLGLETYVASNDGLVRLMSRAHGATILTCQQLLADCSAAQEVVALRIQSSNLATAVSRDLTVPVAGIDRILREEDEDGNWDFNTALQRRLIGDDKLKEKAEVARRRQALFVALDTLLERIDKDPHDQSLLNTLHELEEQALSENLVDKAEIRHKKLVIGLLDLIDENWHQNRHALGGSRNSSVARRPSAPA